MEIIIVEELLFSFPNLEPFTDSTMNTSIRKEEELPTIPSILSIYYLEAEDNSDFFSATSSDNDDLPP